MRRHHDIGQGQQPGVDLRLIFPDVQPGAGQLLLLQRLDQRLLVDDAAARGIDEIDMGPQQPDPAPVDQILALRIARRVDGEDVDPRQHRVEIGIPGRAELGFEHVGQPMPVVIMDGEAEGAGAARHRLAYAAHADNAERLAADAMAEHAAWAPAGPLSRTHQLLALGEAARHRDDERHGHVGGVLGEHAGRVGHDDVAGSCCRERDMVHARAVIGDELQPLAGARDQRRVEIVGDGGHQHVAILHRRGQFGAAHPGVGGVEPDVEQLGHARLRLVGQGAGDDDARCSGPGTPGHGPRDAPGTRLRSRALSRVRRGTLAARSPFRLIGRGGHGKTGGHRSADGQDMETRWAWRCELAGESARDWE